MALKLNRLTAKFVATVSKKGTYGDGGGLFLQVGIGGKAKSYIFIYRRGRFGKPRDSKGSRGYAGLGPVTAVSLPRARELAQECRELLAHKPPIDPHTEFQRREREQAKAHAKTKNFYEMAESYIAARENDPDQPLHVTTRQGYQYNLKRYLTPLHEKLPAEITAKDIYDIIQPLRRKGRRSTAHNNRTLTHRVIEWARANGAFPKTEINPASMAPGSPLRVLLNTDSTNPKSTPLKALHFSKIPALFAKLDFIERRSDFVVAEAVRACGKAHGTLYNAIRSGRLIAYKPERPFSSQSMDHWLIKPAELFKVYPQVAEVIPGLPSVALHVLKYQILTATRPSETLGMRWKEWEEETKVWHLPYQRVKQGGRTRQDHYVPLSEPAIAILEALREQQRRDGIETEFVFGSYWTANLTSARIGIPPCKSTIKNLLELNVDKVDVDKTLHGMRTAFDSWATRLGYKEADIERGLSHIRGYGSTPVARIYNRDAYKDDDGDPNVISAFGEDPLRELFDAWANYCLTGELPKGSVLREPAEVVSIPRHWSMK